VDDLLGGLRTGLGLDQHALVQGREFVLGGSGFPLSVVRLATPTGMRSCTRLWTPFSEPWVNPTSARCSLRVTHRSAGFVH